MGEVDRAVLIFLSGIAALFFLFGIAVLGLEEWTTGREREDDA